MNDTVMTVFTTLIILFQIIHIRDIFNDGA